MDLHALSVTRFFESLNALENCIPHSERGHIRTSEAWVGISAGHVKTFDRWIVKQALMLVSRRNQCDQSLG